eukprot:ctg_534.g305
MRKTLLLLLLLLCLAALLVRRAAAEDASGSVQSSLVREVDGSAFDAHVRQMFGNATAAILLEIYAPWCGHCRRLEPVMRDVAQALSGPSAGAAVATLVSERQPVSVCRLDGARYGDVSMRFGADGFPALYILLKNAAEAGRPGTFFYAGPHTAEGIVQAVHLGLDGKLAGAPDVAIPLRGWRDPFGWLLPVCSAAMWKSDHVARWLLRHPLAFVSMVLSMVVGIVLMAVRHRPRRPAPRPAKTVNKSS